MIRYSDYRQGKLRESIKRSSVLQGVDLYFDLLQMQLEEVARLPMNLNEAFDPQYAETLAIVAEIDHEINSHIIRDHVKACKEAFNDYMLETADFSSFIRSLGHQDARMPSYSLDLLRRDVRLAVVNFRAAIRKLIEPIINSRQAPQADPSQAQGSPASPQGNPGSATGGGLPGGGGGAPSPRAGGAPAGQPRPSGSPVLPRELDPNHPAQPPITPHHAGGAPAAAAPAGSKYSLWDRLHHRTSGPGASHGLSNLGKTLIKPAVWVGDRLRDAWKGKYLRDPLPEHVMESLKVIFENSAVDILGQIDTWADELLKFIDDNLQHYAQAVTGTAPSPTAAKPSMSAPKDASQPSPQAASAAPAADPAASTPGAPTAAAEPAASSVPGAPAASAPDAAAPGTPPAPRPPRGINSPPMSKEDVIKMLQGSGGLQHWKLQKVARELGVLDKVADPTDGMALAKAIADHVGTNIGHRKHLGPIKGKLTPDEIQTLPAKTEDELVELSKTTPGKAFLGRIARLVGVKGAPPSQEVPAAAYARNLYSVIQQAVKEKSWGNMISNYNAVPEPAPAAPAATAAPAPAAAPTAGSGEQEMRKPPNDTAAEPNDWNTYITQALRGGEPAQPAPAPASAPEPAAATPEAPAASQPQPQAPEQAPAADKNAARLDWVMKGMEEDFGLDLSDPQVKADLHRIAKAQLEANPDVFPDDKHGNLDLLKATAATYQKMLSKRGTPSAPSAPSAPTASEPAVSAPQPEPAAASEPTQPEASPTAQPEPAAAEVPPPPGTTHEPVAHKPKHSHDDVFDSAWSDHNSKSELFDQAFNMLPDDLKKGVDERTVHHALNRIYDPSKHPTPASLAAEIQRKAAQLRVASEAHKLIDPSVRDMDPEMTDRLLHQMVGTPTYEINKLSRSGQLTPEKISEKAQLIANKLSGRLLGEAVKKKLSEFVPKLKSMIDFKGLTDAFNGDENLANSELLGTIRRFAEGRDKVPDQELLQRLGSLDDSAIARIAAKLNRDVGNTKKGGGASDDQFDFDDKDNAPDPLEPEDFNKSDEEKESLKKRRSDSTDVPQRDYDLARINTKLADTRMPDGSPALEYLAKHLGKERDPDSPEGGRLSPDAVHGKVQELINSAYQNTTDKHGAGDADRAVQYLLDHIRSLYTSAEERRRQEEEEAVRQRRARAQSGGQGSAPDDEFLANLDRERRQRDLKLSREEEAAEEAEKLKKKRKKSDDDDEQDLNRGHRRGKRVEDEEDSFAHSH
jgi:hypothetical protein